MPFRLGVCAIGLNPRTKTSTRVIRGPIQNRPAWQRFLTTIAAALSLATCLPAPLIFFLHAVIGVHGVMVHNVLPTGPAAAGIQAGGRPALPRPGDDRSVQMEVLYYVDTSETCLSSRLAVPGQEAGV